MNHRPVTVRNLAGRYMVTALIKREYCGNPYFQVECRNLRAKNSFIITKAEDIEYVEIV